MEAGHGEKEVMAKAGAGGAVMRMENRIKLEMGSRSPDYQYHMYKDLSVFQQDDGRRRRHCRMADDFVHMCCGFAGIFIADMDV